MAARRISQDPYLTHRFKAEIDGLLVASFSEVTGLDVETAVESFYEGGVNTYQHQLPGATNYPSKLVLKRGLADSDELWWWYQHIIKGDIWRQTVSVILLDLEGRDRARWRWNFAEACPIKWSGPQFRATAGEIAFETIEIVHKGLLENDGVSNTIR